MSSFDSSNLKNEAVSFPRHLRFGQFGRSRKGQVQQLQSVQIHPPDHGGTQLPSGSGNEQSWSKQKKAY